MTGDGRSPRVGGVLAAGMAVAATEFAAGLLPGGRSVFGAVADAAIDRTPGPLVRVAIETFGGANRTVLALSMVLVVALLGALVGHLAARRWWFGPAGLAAFAALGAGVTLLDPLVPASTALVATSFGALAGVGTLRPFVRPPTPGGRSPRWFQPPAVQTEADPADAVDPARRSLLVGALAVVASAAVLATTGRWLQRRGRVAAAIDAATLPPVADPLPPPPAAASLDIGGLAPLVTPNEEFFRIDSAFSVPRIEPSSHRVRFTGLVDHPFEISYDELVDLARTEADVTLACVSNEVGGHLVGNARWLGVRLGDLLDRAGVRPSATQVVGRSVDGWTGGFPVEVVHDGRPALVAVGMNGQPLPAEHGFPVRLVIAGLYGYVSDTKWLSEVELTTFDAYDAYWIRRGWGRYGPIKTQSRIDVPARDARVAAGTVPVAGVAWAGERGISAVEVAVDDGPWQPAELAEELAATSWRQWVLRWVAEPGTHQLRVRATDAAGETQTGTVAPPAPDGATGHHTIRVTVA